MSPHPAVEWRALRFAYPRQSTLFELPDFSLAQGAAAAISGPSGSGKSTLLELIAGRLQPSGGALTVLGCAPAAARASLAAKIGFIFQDFPLVPALNVVENVLLPLRLLPGLRVDAAAVARARSTLAGLGLGGAAAAHTQALSAGERQRVAIARALITEPALILADEPTTGLDPARAAAVISLLLEVCAERGASLLCVSHDPAVLARFAARVGMGDGAAQRVDHAG